MRLVTWNVQGGGKHGDAQRAFLLSQAPDVVALQEVAAGAWPAWQEGLQAAGLPHSRTTLNGAEKKGLVLASRYPLGQTLKQKYWLPHDPTPVLAAVVLDPQRPVEVHVAHVPNGSGGNPKLEVFDALALSLQQPAQHPRILCGDFNSPCEESEDGTTLCTYPSGRRPKSFPTNSGEWERAWHAREWQVMHGLQRYDLTDVFRGLYGFAEPAWSKRDVRLGHESWRRRFDHIFASRDAGAVRCWHDYEPEEDGISDHVPVLADFDVGADWVPQCAEFEYAWEDAVAQRYHRPQRLERGPGLADVSGYWIIGDWRDEDAVVVLRMRSATEKFWPGDHLYAARVFEAEGTLDRVAQEWLMRTRLTDLTTLVEVVWDDQ